MADTHGHTQLAQHRDPERGQTPADCRHQKQCKHTDVHANKEQVVFTPTDDFHKFTSNILEGKEKVHLCVYDL